MIWGEDSGLGFAVADHYKVSKAYRRLVSSAPLLTVHKNSYAQSSSGNGYAFDSMKERFILKPVGSEA